MDKLPSFSIVISLTEDYHNLCWLKLDPPEDWRIDEKDHKFSFKHTHDEESRYFSVRNVDVRSIGKCKYPISCSSATIGSTIYCVGGDKDIEGKIRTINYEKVGPPVPPRKKNLSHRIGSCDFFNCPLPPQDEDWKLDNAPTLVSPRYCPHVLAVGRKIFLFGGNSPPVNQLEYVPFAEVFDLEKGVCSPISDPPFANRIGSSCLFLAPLLSKDGQHKILVMSQILSFKDPPAPGSNVVYLYDVKTDTWENFQDPDRNLFYKSFDFYGDPVPVAEQDSVYWLKRSIPPKKTVVLFSYNWKTKHFWEGHFIGLEHERTFLRPTHNPKRLFHVHQDLFCLVWYDISSTDDDQFCTHIHFTLLRVCREDPPSPSLSAFVVGCFSRLVPMACYVRNPYVLRCDDT